MQAQPSQATAFLAEALQRSDDRAWVLWLNPVDARCVWGNQLANAAGVARDQWAARGEDLILLVGSGPVG